MTILTRTDFACGICSYIWTMFDMVCYEVIHGNKDIMIALNGCNYGQLSGSDPNKNYWEDYLEQPFGQIETTGNSVIKSFRNFSILDPLKIPMLDAKVLFRKCIKFKRNIVDIAEKFIQDNSLQNAIGVLMRKTDYNSTWAKNHPKQPSVQQIEEDIVNSIQLFPEIDSIFVMSEVDESFQQIQKTFGESKRVIRLQKATLDGIGNHSCNQFFQKLQYEEKVRINTEYLASLIVMSKLKFLLLGRTSATSVLKYMIGDHIKLVKEYDLGLI